MAQAETAQACTVKDANLAFTTERPESNPRIPIRLKTNELETLGKPLWAMRGECDRSPAQCQALPALSNLVHTATLEGRYYNKLHFTDGEAEAQRDK